MLRRFLGRSNRNTVQLEREISPQQQTDELYESALSSHNNGEFDTAISQFRKVEKTLLKESASSTTLCYSYYYLGSALQFIGNYEESIEYLKNAIDMNIQKSEKFKALCHQTLAISLRYRGDYGLAIHHYQESIQIQQQQSPGVGSLKLALCYVGFAATFCELGNLSKAEDFFDLALANLACMKCESEALGVYKYHHGILCQEKEDWARALQEFTTAKKILQKFQNFTVAALCQREMAMVFFRQGKYTKASELLDDALQDLKTRGWTTIDVAASHTSRGILYSAENDIGNALIHFDKAEKIFAKKAPRSLEFAKLCIALGQLQQDKGDLSNALHRFQHAESIYKCHHSRGSNVENLAEKIESLGVVLATENAQITGTPTAVARNVREITRQHYPQYNKHAADSVIAWPADGHSTLGDMPLAESVFPEHAPNIEELTEISETDEVAFTGSTQTPEVEETSHPESNHKIRPRILVLHDDKLSNTWFATSSLTEKYDIINATSISEVIRIIVSKSNRPDVIVSSLKMQVEMANGISSSAIVGLKLIRQIRCANFVIPIIIYTTSATEVELFRAETMRLGGNAIISETQSLHETVARCLLLYSEKTLCTTDSKDESSEQMSQDVPLPDSKSLSRNLLTYSAGGPIPDTSPTPEHSETQPSPILTTHVNLEIVSTQDQITSTESRTNVAMQEHQPNELLTEEDRPFDMDSQTSDWSQYSPNQQTQFSAMHISKKDPPGTYSPWKYDEGST
jgi:tetratricopeptide (TPR) repeat protein/CheY-like chemotaxis protein